MISFSEAHPELVSEWSKENKDKPGDISYGSNKVVLWTGKCGHTWDAPVKARSKGEKCPICSGKRVVEGINDLATTHAEISGEWSDKNPFSPSDVTAGSSLKAIWECENGHEWKAIIKNRANGSKCPFCTSHKVKKGFNDLATIRPEIATEWSKRNRTSPSSVLPYSNKKVWWICPCGHEYRALISSRSRGSMCPICQRKVIKKGVNDLLTEYPDISAEWGEKNEKKSPKGISSKSRQVAWWKCNKCGHEWQAGIYLRTLGRGCPKCANLERKKKVLEVKNRERLYSLFVSELPEETIKNHTKDNNIKMYFNSDSLIGVPVQFYFPDYKAAIIFSKESHNNIIQHRRENVINDLLKKNGVRLIRILRHGDFKFDNCINIILEDESVDSLGDAISSAFRILKLPGAVKLVDEFNEMFEKYCSIYD